MRQIFGSTYIYEKSTASAYYGPLPFGNFRAGPLERETAELIRRDLTAVRRRSMMEIYW
jgi:hypothetical protein